MTSPEPRPTSHNPHDRGPSGDEPDAQKPLSAYGKAFRAAGPLFGSGIQMAASVVLMFFLGRWLDQKFDTAPWIMLVGILFGVTAGLYNFVKIVTRVSNKRDQDTRN